MTDFHFDQNYTGHPSNTFNFTWTLSYPLIYPDILSLYTQGGDGLGNAYFFIKRANFLTERLHCFDSFKSWVRVMVKWGNGLFWEFFGGTLISRGKPKKISKKKYLSLTCCSGHIFGPTECCKSLHRTFMDA